MRYWMALVIIFSVGMGFAVTRHVSVYGTQQYTSIQAAINDCGSGDLILVHPGWYQENLNMSNKNEVILASMEYTTSDTTYISSTIIDGSMVNNPTIMYNENNLNCTIRGFSITGGSGYAYLGDNKPDAILGGGIFFKSGNTVQLKNLNIYGNKAACGGGIYILAQNSVSLANVNLYNNIARYMGGGLSTGSSYNCAPQITFDPYNRCSIYNNFAQWGMDINWAYTYEGSVDVYLKKFTVPQWERYYADFYDLDYTSSPYAAFDIQEGYIQPVDADLYVSPDGNDNHDGLSQFSALKTPSIAMQRIASNPQHPNTVHLLAGEHHNIIAGEYLPVSIKSYTLLSGASETETILYGENLLDGTGVVTMGFESCGMTLKNLSIATNYASAVFAWGVHDFLAEKVTIAHSTATRLMFNAGRISSSMTLRSITMRNNTVLASDFGFHLTGSTITLDNILMKENQTQDMPLYWYQRGCGGFDITVAKSLMIKNSKFINNTHYSEDGFANFRVYTYPDLFTPTYTFDNCLFANNSTYAGARNLDIFEGYLSNMVNCTFANNYGTAINYLLLGAHYNRLVNCIFSNNNAAFEIRPTPNTVIDYCLFSKTNYIYHMASIQWGTHNLTGTNPHFMGGIPTAESYYYLSDDDTHGHSPAIDAGTTAPAVLPFGYHIPEFDALGFARIFGEGIDIGCYEYTGNTDEENIITPEDITFTISPNPFSGATKIRYKPGSVVTGNDESKNNSSLSIAIYNIKGQKIKIIANNTPSKGEHISYWDGRDDNGKVCRSGIYLIKLKQTGKEVITRRVTLLP